MDVGLETSLKIPPVPLTTLHEPVPTAGVFPAKVTCVSPQVLAPTWSPPALAVVGFWLKVIVTSSVEATQGLLLIVQRSV